MRRPVPQMDTEDALVIQIVSELRRGLVDQVRLCPIDRIEQNRTEHKTAQLGAGVRSDIVGQELGSDVAEPSATRRKVVNRHFVQSAEMARVWLAAHDVAEDEIPAMSAPPLQVEEMVAAEWEGTQQDHIGVHPQSALLVEHRIAKEVAEISDLRAGEDLLVESPRDHIVRGAKLNSVWQEKFELVRRIAPDRNRMSRGAHRGGRRDQAWMLRGVGQHFVEAVDPGQR